MSKFSPLWLSFFMFNIMLSVCIPVAVSSSSDYLQNECLKIPISKFVGSLKTVVDVVQDVASFISKSDNSSDDFRLANARTDCVDLLDLSADQLSWSISASQNPNVSKNNGVGNLSADLRTWLSAAIVNQDTCIEGLDGTNSTLKSLVAGKLNQITSLLQEMLTKVDPSPNSKSNNDGLSGIKNGKNDQFPSWVKHQTQKLLLENGVTPDVIVAADGTGNFTKIMDAVSAAPAFSMRRFVIYIKKGTYNEYVEINKTKWNLMMVGDGMNATSISGNRNFVDGWTTFSTATFSVSGRGFIARDITFENTAGPEKHQAVALRSDSDLSIFFRCEIKGYQDSLYTHIMRQFYRECRISGTIDFIFGDATAVFQKCQILAKKGLSDQKNTITAQGRKQASHPTGYSIQFCNISADIDLLPYENSTSTFLGRPWKNFSRTVVMQSYLSNAIRPEGWLKWDGDDYLDTLYYGEYKNDGPGAKLGNRVKWPGYHILNDSSQATNFTVAEFIKGNLWLQQTGVNYTAGL